MFSVNVQGLGFRSCAFRPTGQAAAAAAWGLGLNLYYSC